MGPGPAKRATPDLFSGDGGIPGTPTVPITAKTKEATGPVRQRYILPKNLRQAVKQLNDAELDELFEVAFDEAKQRGRLPRSVRTEMPPSALRPSESVTKRLLPTDKREKVSVAGVSLTRGQINAVWAAFKAGVTPSRIARQFGISQANVRKALANNPPK
jgi:hypothetical protein